MGVEEGARAGGGEAMGTLSREGLEGTGTLRGGPELKDRWSDSKNAFAITFLRTRFNFPSFCCLREQIMLQIYPEKWEGFF